MERELFHAVYQRAHQLGRSRRTKHVVFPDWKIVVVFVWAVLHDRPICWACDARNWPTAARKCLRSLPSESTMCRRLRRREVLALIDDIEHSAKPHVVATNQLLFIDAKALPVGWYTHDPEAVHGWGTGGIAKGYKFHVICDELMMPTAWTVRPMNEREPAVAPQLIIQLSGCGTLVGDGAYDSNKLYDLAAEHGHQLVAPRRPGTKLGKIRHSPHRLIAHVKMKRRERQSLITKRAAVERFFGRLGNHGWGLSGLPNWVRRLRRVRLWVQAKVILYLFAHRITAPQE